MTLQQLVDCLTVKPAEVFDLPYGQLKEGAIADIVLVDLEKEQEINTDEFASKGKNTPFNGMEMHRMAGFNNFRR